MFKIKVIKSFNSATIMNCLEEDEGPESAGE